MALGGYVAWALVLLAQNFSFVLVSRARNSTNIWYHAGCSLLSNGVWFIQNLILMGNIFEVFRNGNWAQAVGIGLFYTFFTMSGAIAAHYFALRHLERRIKT